MLYLNNEFFKILPTLYGLNISIYTDGQVHKMEYRYTNPRKSCYNQRYFPFAEYMFI